ncbi:MAG: L,D-transpeptidase [Kineosporiaceae bacterium]
MTRTRRPLTARAATVSFATAALAALALSGCGGTADPQSAADDTTPRTAASAGSPAPSGAGASPEDSASSPVAAATAVAVLDADVAIHSAPEGDTLTTLTATTPLGTTRVLRVIAASPDGAWLQVRVPARPNNSDGWVAAQDVSVQAVRHHITVDLSDRELVLFEDGVEVMAATVAIGTSQNPTPTGEFFLTDKLSTDPDGAYGPYALGVAAWSETLSEFAGGDGQIGLHGTNEPGLLGQEVSHGCIRVANDVIEALAAELPLGVPVDIRA